MRPLLIINIIMALTAVVYGRKDMDELQQRQIAMIEQLRKEYNRVQDEFQEATAAKWAARQRQVEKLKRNKTEIENMQREIDRVHSDLARVQEESLAKIQALNQEKNRLEKEKERYAFLGQIVTDKLEKTKKTVISGFPLSLEKKLAQINTVEQDYNSLYQPATMHTALVKYFIRSIELSAQSGVGRQNILLSGNKPVTAQVLRIGNIFAYAYTPDATAYTLAPTGKLGENAYYWVPVTNESLRMEIGSIFPQLIKEKKIDVSLPVDIIRNRASQTLITGKKKTQLEKLQEFFLKGGLTMIPLAVIVLWAVLLIITRLIYFTCSHNHDYRFIHHALDLLEKDKVEEAQNYAKKEKGGLARILQTCIEHSRWTRDAAERAVKELLLKEFPKLDKHLDTLAALAGAAPLLGLLGTVTGMIRMFEAITKFGTADPQLLAGGISEALVTTLAGLSIAIPLLLLHTLLSNTRNRIQSDMEHYAMSILNRLWPAKQILLKDTETV